MKLQDYNENELLLLVAEGDEYAFRELFDRYKAKIYSVGLRITKSEVSAEELLQDVFLIIWVKRERLNQIEDFESYLFIVARNEAYRSLRNIAKQKNRTADIDLNEDLYHRETEEAISFNEYNKLLQKLIETLPSQQKQAYKLIKEQGHTREQTAEIMGVSPDTVKTHLARAMKSVRAYCKANFELGLMIAMMLRGPH